MSSEYFGQQGSYSQGTVFKLYHFRPKILDPHSDRSKQKKCPGVFRRTQSKCSDGLHRGSLSGIKQTEQPVAEVPRTARRGLRVVGAK